MKKDWTYKTLGEVCIGFYRGLTYSKSDEVTTSSNKVLRSNNIDLSSHTLNFDDVKCIREDLVIPYDRKLKKGSIFICMSNGSMQHLGKVAYVDKDYDYAFGGFMGLIVPDKNIVVPKFAYYSLLAPNFLTTILREGRGANINNLKFSDLDEYPIPLPPLSLQEQIVGELDLLHSVIEKKQQQLRELDTLAQSLFYQMFGDPITNPMGWEVKKLGEVAEITDGSHNPPKGEDDSTKFMMLSSQNIFDNFIDYSKGVRYLSEENFVREHKRTNLQPGDVLLTIVGTIGRSCIVSEKDANITLQRSVAVLSPKSEVHPNYLNNYLHIIADNLQKEARGVAQKGIYLGQLSNQTLPLPPLSLQQSFALKVEAIEAQKAAITESITHVQALLAQRMDHYFG